MKKTITLKPHQKNLIKLTLNKNKNNINNFFAELPTGSGKSIILTYLALLYAKAQGKKVIIATSTTQLALELLNVFNKFSFKNNKYSDYLDTKDIKLKNKIDIDMVIGKENYVDIANLDVSIFNNLVNNPIEIYEKIITLSKKGKNHLLIIDLFLDELNIEEEAKYLLKKLLSTKEKKEYIKDFDEVDISITNQAYLLIKAFYDKNFNINDYIILIDEVHLISDTAENLLQSNFSLFRFHYLLENLLNKIETAEKFSGQVQFKKNLQKIKEQKDILYKKYQMPKKAGLTFTNTEESIKIVKEIKARLLKKELLNIFNKIDKLKTKQLSMNLIKAVELFENEYKELKEFSNANEKEISIYFSPSQGYVSLSVLKTNYLFKLKDLWDKTDFLTGVSATLYIDNDIDFIKTRLGLNLIEKNNTAFYKMPPVFKKNQINVSYIDKQFPKPDTKEDEVSKIWIEAIGNEIIESFNNKNSLVLMGGFLEVESLYEYLNSKLPETNILKAQRKKSVYTIIKEFKEKGGILIGTRNYGTGVDLKEKLLENLYITKLPYPIIVNKKWMELKKVDKMRGTNYSYFMSEKEMLLNLKQWIGRLIRTEEDKGNLYILDSRIHTNYRLDKINKLIKSIFR